MKSPKLGFGIWIMVKLISDENFLFDLKSDENCIEKSSFQALFWNYCKKISFKKVAIEMAF